MEILVRVLVWISLCNLCVLGVSVVNEFVEENHHRDTEDTEVAQRGNDDQQCEQDAAKGSFLSQTLRFSFVSDIAETSPSAQQHLA